MTKASDRFPEDEFDAEPAPDAPIGVHRAPRSWWSRWWPFVAVVVLVPAVTVGLVAWASSWDGRLPGFGDSSEPAAAAPSASGTTAPAPETEDPGAEDPDAEAPAETEAPPVEEEEPAPTADLTTDVRVLNASGRSGLAAGAAGDLEDAGFTSVTTGNGNAGGLQQTTVFYASADLAPTAQQVADSLGIANVVEDAGTAPEGVVVLLLADFAR